MDFKEFEQQGMQDQFRDIDDLFDELHQTSNEQAYLDNFFGGSSDLSDNLNPSSDNSSEEDNSPLSSNFLPEEMFVPGSSPFNSDGFSSSPLFPEHENSNVLLRGLDFDFSQVPNVLHSDLDPIFFANDKMTVSDLMVVTGELPSGAFGAAPHPLPPLPEMKSSIKVEVSKPNSTSKVAATAANKAKVTKATSKVGNGFVELSHDQILTLTSAEIEVYIKNVRMHKNPTQAQERELKRIRRLIKNREYAQNSRDKKRNHLESVEGQMGVVQQENAHLKERVAKLEEENARITGVLSRLQGAIRKDPIIMNRLKTQIETPSSSSETSKKRKIGTGGVFMFAVLFMALFSPISNPLFNGFSFSSDALAQPSIGQTMLTKSGVMARNMLGDSVFNGGKGWAEWAAAYLPQGLSEALHLDSNPPSEEELYNSRMQQEIEKGERRGEEGGFHNESSVEEKAE